MFPRVSPALQVPEVPELRVGGSDASKIEIFRQGTRNSGAGQSVSRRIRRPKLETPKPETGLTADRAGRPP